MQLSVGASRDDAERLKAMLRAVARFGHELGRICDDCVTALEETAPPGAAGDETTQRHAGEHEPPPPR